MAMSIPMASDNSCLVLLSVFEMVRFRIKKQIRAMLIIREAPTEIPEKVRKENFKVSYVLDCLVLLFF